MQQFIHLKTDPKEVVCHVMISECGAQGGFSLSASFLPSLDPKQDKKGTTFGGESREWGRKTPKLVWNLTRPCRGSVTHERLHFHPADWDLLLQFLSFLFPNPIDRFYAKSRGFQF